MGNGEGTITTITITTMEFIYLFSHFFHHEFQWLIGMDEISLTCGDDVQRLSLQVHLV